MRVLPTFLCLLLLCPVSILSCQRHQSMAGRYESVNPTDHRNGPMILALRADGKGSWTMKGEEVPFQWDAGSDKIWLHSKSGGVIEGKIGRDESIHLTLPGVGVFLFKKR